MTKRDRKMIEKRITKLRDMLHEEEGVQWLLANRHRVGKCYKYQNGYGNDNRWPLYAKVLSIEARIFVCFVFQTDCYGKIEIIPKEHTYLSGFEEITHTEYRSAYLDLYDKLGDMRI